MDRRLVFIAVVLAVQAVLPLSYYASERRYDERFAWRMFSPIRMVRCQLAYTANGSEVNLNAEFHSAWVTLMQRGREGVVEAVDRRVCLLNGGRDVRKHYRCRGVDGSLEELAQGEEPLCP